MIKEKTGRKSFLDIALAVSVVIVTVLVAYGSVGGGGAAAPSGSAVVGAAVGHNLDRYLERIVPFGFSGAVLVAKDGNIILNKGYGMAIRSKGIANTADTVLNTGSLTKQFTAAGIMKLEMMGKLESSDPITRYFKNVPPDKAGITLHHLLTHSSGVVDAVGDDYVMAGRDETVQKILKEPLQFKPGEAFSYSNAGYTLLAAVIERVSGQDYETFLHEQLFVPAGMNFTGYRLPDWKERTVAHWYVGETDNGTPLEKPYPSWYVIGNGEILSTPMDMYKWHLALLGNKILSDKVKKKMFTPYLNDYGYGWDVLNEDHGLLIQHDGGSGLGSSAEFRRYIGAGVVTIVFCNQGYNNTGRALFSVIRDKIEALAFGKHVAEPPETGQIVPAFLTEYSGFYKLNGAEGFNVSVRNKGLYLEPRGQAAVNAMFFDDPGAPETVAGLARQSKSAFDAILKGDYKPLEATLWNREKRAQRVREYIEMRLKDFKEHTGKLTGAAVVQTLPMADGATYKTTVQLKGETGSVYFDLYYRDGQNTGVAPVMEPETPGMAIGLLKGKTTEFAAYHLPLARTIRLDFKVDKTDGAITLALGEAGHQKIAVKR